MEVDDKLCFMWYVDTDCITSDFFSSASTTLSVIIIFKANFIMSQSQVHFSLPISLELIVKMKKQISACISTWLYYRTPFVML